MWQIISVDFGICYKRNYLGFKEAEKTLRDKVKKAFLLCNSQEINEMVMK